MAAEAIQIRARGAKLFKETGDERIADYKTMPLDDLKAHIEAIQSGGSAPARPKGKTAASTNGASADMPTRSKGKSSADKPKGKSTASTSSPAKSTARKSPAKGKGSAGTAKRTTAAAGKGKGKSSTAKRTTSATTGRASTAKPKTTTARKTSTSRSRSRIEGASRIDNKAVDWKAEWNGGKVGKRADVMSALRRYKGDKAKVFDLLAPKAKTYYKGRTKDEAERMLVWLIGRVAFDFVTATGQHEVGTRDKHGASKDPRNIARRERRAEANAEAKREQRRAARAASGSKSKTTSTAKRKTATKGKGRR